MKKFALFTTILAFSTFVSAQERGKPSASFDREDLGMYWTPIEAVFSSGNEDELQIFHSLVAAQKERGTDCLEQEFDSETDRYYRDVALDSLLDVYEIALAGRVISVHPGLRDSHRPSTIIEMAPDEMLRGSLRGKTIFFELSSFDADLPNGEHLCSREYSTRVPRPGEEVVLFLGEGSTSVRGKKRSEFPQGWIPDLHSLLIIVSENDLEAPSLQQGKFNAAFQQSRSSNESPRQWIKSQVLRGKSN